MGDKKIPALAAVAAAQADEKKKGSVAKALGMIATALGIAPLADVKPSAKMSKRTTTTKRVEMEESDESGSDSDEETTGSGSEDTESTGTPAADGEAEGEEGKSASEEEEEKGSKALARAVGKALASVAVRSAFLAELPENLREVGALYTPDRISSAVRKATGAKSTFAAMEALSGLSRQQKGNAEAMLQKQAKLEARVAKVEGARRADRVAALVSVAKERGTPGATSKEGRAMLRDYGMRHGTKALSAFIQSQGPGLRTSEAIPKVDAEGNALGAPTFEDQNLMEKAMAGLSEKDREQFKALATENLKKLNGAAATPRGI